MSEWLQVLRAAQAHVVQIPAERLGERATQGRDRSLRELAPSATPRRRPR